jgi:hypothetical protein
MQLKLSDLEIELLRKLVNGEAVSISSQQRVRLEGVIREGAKGIVVTPTGRGLAREKPAEASASDSAPEAKVSRDGRGRRMPFQRRSVF